MPIEIRITANPDFGPVAKQINEAMAALGFVRATDVLAHALVPVRGVESVQNDAGLSGDIGADLSPGTSFTAGELNAVAQNAEATYVKRERGQPSPGKARRTKAEIAEDEAFFRIHAGGKEALERDEAADRREAEIAERVADDTQHAGVIAGAAISTGEERVGPEDDAETVEQDEADETAETEAAIEERPADKKLTHDDVRNALGAYVKQYGMAAAQADGPKVISLVCGEGKVKMSDIPDDQALLAKVVAGIDEMLTKNPFKRDKVA